MAEGEGKGAERDINNEKRSFLVKQSQSLWYRSQRSIIIPAIVFEL